MMSRQRTYGVIAGLLVAIAVGLELIYPENPLTAALVWAGRAIIIAYAVHQAIIFVAGRADDTLEALSGLGGLLYLAGVHLWTVRGGGPAADLDLMLRVLGVALMLLPRVWRVTYNALLAD